MNEYQRNLYNDLIKLVELSEAFYYKDFELEDSIYRIFNYRLASYTEFLHPSAMECRGIMFEVEDSSSDAQPLRLAALPMQKFFNLNENPMTMDLDLTSVVEIDLKADGSLISTYWHNNKLRLKSKGSLESEQAFAAMEWLNRPENTAFRHELEIAALFENTVNLEWCAPDNRIVISYGEPQLTVLNIRNNLTGGYLSLDNLARAYPEITARRVEQLEIDDPISFVAKIPDMEGVEGYVVRLASGQRVKIKTEWYLTQHRAKDSINSPRRLFEACIEEATDDLRSLFYDDPVVINMIDEMEKFADGVYNHTVDQVERFYERNKKLERKDYALLGQKELDKKLFGLAMSKYLGRDVDYKHFMRKNYKSFGVADDPVDEVE